MSPGDLAAQLVCSQKPGWAEPFSVRTILGAPSLCAGSPGLGIKHGLETSCLCEDGEGEVLMASWLKWFTALRGTTTGRVRQGVSDFLD